LGSAYTPGLKVSARTRIEKIRRLPLKGRVLAKEGDLVTPATVIATTELPGILQTVRLSEKLGVEPHEVSKYLQVNVGDRIEKGALLAQTKGIFGMFKSEELSPYSGTLELIAEQSGHLGIRQAPTPIEKDAYLRGRVTRVIPDEGVVVQCEGALIQGIFGVGGERQGTIQILTKQPGQMLTDSLIGPEHSGKIVVGGSGVTADALRKAAQTGVAGIVVGAVVDRDLIEYLREALTDPAFDIGVAITGHEPIPFTLVVTEGFGEIPMALRTFELLRSLEGQEASINGATQIRAGVIRPEVIVSLKEDEITGAESDRAESGELLPGTPIRCIREPYFGLLGTVTHLPPELVQVESETWVRVLETTLADGRAVTVPRANVEIIEEA
jgi:hypothetical protein